MANLIPEVHATGTFVLAPPFDTQFNPQLLYTVVAVRQFAAIVDAGGNVFTDYYEPNGLTQTDYLNDVAQSAVIVTLRSGSGRYQHLPSSYIKSFPMSGGIPYATLVLGVALGPVPEQLDLTLLITRIKSEVSDTLGITDPEVQVAAVSPVSLKAQSDHIALEQARQQNIVLRPTDAAKIRDLEAQLQAVTAERNALAAYIEANPVP